MHFLLDKYDEYKRGDQVDRNAQHPRGYWKEEENLRYAHELLDSGEFVGYSKEQLQEVKQRSQGRYFISRCFALFNILVQCRECTKQTISKKRNRLCRQPKLITQMTHRK